MAPIVNIYTFQKSTTGFPAEMIPASTKMKSTNIYKRKALKIMYKSQYGAQIKSHSNLLGGKEHRDDNHVSCMTTIAIDVIDSCSKTCKISELQVSLTRIMGNNTIKNLLDQNSLLDKSE